ncbi:hypothetical protein B0T24DRAFT_560333 [Lasiosphaeria ovina]|uniref:NACHT domain-containing protein n=1 Tax=Lasiosphaeria ovina TaxID=92902 RepID=A0AAE0JXW9_9PEZI|nr:hypothetical protein B0T24DRAFT_560333 [Lasiosphaeria ovina]
MAEALAFAASVTAIVQIADRIIDVCKYYIRTARDAPSDFRTILVETSTLKTLFENLEFLTEHQDGISAAASKLADDGGSIKSCLQSIGELEKLLSSQTIPTGQSQSKKQKLKFVVSSLAWPLKETRARKLLGEMRQCKETINLVLTAEIAGDVKFVKQKAVELHEILTESQRLDVVKWVERTDPSPIHIRNQKLYEPGTGEWIKRSPHWDNWLAGKDRCLWLHGIPGAGKTVLMSHLIEETKGHCKKSSDGEVAWVYYYCYFGHSQDETTPFLRWVIGQLCRQSRYVPSALYAMYRRGTELSLAELLNILESIISRFSRVSILVDALDESASPRDDLLKVLRDLLTDPRFRRIQVIASSREYLDIEKAMDSLSISIPMDNSLVEDDIRLYVNSRLASNTKFHRWPRDLLAEVEDTLAKKARGMFRWAVCQIDAIQRLRPDYGIVRAELATLPRTLDETYNRIFLSIDEEERPFVSHVLRWIYFDNKAHGYDHITCPVILDAVYLSISKEIQSQKYVYDEDALRELCGCLITITKFLEDESSRSEGTVSFAHYTVLEYLESQRITMGPIAMFALRKDILDDNLARVLFNEALRQGPRTLSENSRHIDSWYKLTAMSILENTAWTEMILCDHDICELVFELFRPTRPGYANFCQAFRPFVDEPWAYTQWEPMQDNCEKSAILLNLLWHGNYRGPIFRFAEAYIQRNPDRDIFLNQISVRKAEFPFTGEDSTIALKGTVVEIVAQLKPTHSDDLSFLLDHATGLLDPTKILHIVSGMWFPISNWDQYIKRGVLAKLVSLGADLNLEAYRLTPLQIATTWRDKHLVVFLLENGADPNRAGNVDGITWSDGSLMARYNPGIAQLYTFKPLEICRLRLGDISVWFKNEQGQHEKEPLAFRKDEMEEIEKLLVKYGALDKGGPPTERIDIEMGREEFLEFQRALVDENESEQSLMEEEEVSES